jgi:hypothetical protein
VTTRAPAGVRCRLPWIVAAVGAVTVAAGLALDAAGMPLGVPLPPLLGGWVPRAHPLLAASVACFAATVWLGPRLLSPRLGPAAFALTTLALTLVLRLALAAGRGGTAEWSRVFDVARSFEAKNEYLPALRALRYGPRWFLDRFAELVPSLPVHAAGHPPGLLLLLYALGVRGPGAMAALCIGAGALGVPLAYGLGRTVLRDDRTARVGALLLAVAPSALLFGATSADALYLTLGLLAAWPLASRRRLARIAGAVALAVVSLCSWSLLAVGAWAAILACRREGRRAAVELAATCALALAGVWGLIAAATGFDPIGTIRATGQVYRLGIAASRPSWYWVLGSPVAFLLVLGLPIAWSALRGLAEGAAPALAVFAVLAIASVLGVTKAETERIWLFLVPLVCLAAAPVVARRPDALGWLLAALGVQALVHEALLETVW